VSGAVGLWIRSVVEKGRKERGGNSQSVGCVGGAVPVDDAAGGDRQVAKVGERGGVFIEAVEDEACVKREPE